MNWPVALSVLLLVAQSAQPTFLASQQVRSKPITEARSSGQVLRLTERVRLGSMDGAHDAFGRIMDVALSRSGRILVADDQNHRVVVFGPDGRYVGAVGRRGQGPGEFQSPWQVAADPQDSIFVWDVSLARISVFDPGLKFVRSFRVPPQWVVNDVRFLPDGRLLLAAYGREERGALHIVDRLERLAHTFGPRFNAPDLAGFESSLLGGSVDIDGKMIVYSVKSPYEIWFFHLNGSARGRCTGQRKWTTQPAEAIQREDDAVTLRWKQYVHSSAVLSLGNGLYLNQVLDPAGDRTHLDVLSADCRLLRRTALNSPIRITDVYRPRLAAVRNLEYPEVVVYEARVTRVR